MLRAINKSFKIATTKSSFTGCSVLARNFSNFKLNIPTDEEQQWGRRKEEMESEAHGGGYNRDPIIPPQDAGTKENPILVT
jgi:hypothetical protein